MHNKDNTKEAEGILRLSAVDQDPLYKCQGFYLTFCPVTMALFHRDDDPKTPCKWPFKP